MPVTPTYPGVYIEEVPSQVRTIVGVATSITAFIGRARRGPVNEPIMIHNFSDFERQFGGLWISSTMSYAVQHYFLNGGSIAIIVRIINKATKATISLPPGGNGLSLELEAANEGRWGNNLRIRVDYDTKEPDSMQIFNLTVKDSDTGKIESFRNISTDTQDPRFVKSILDQESDLIRVDALRTLPTTKPAENDSPSSGEDPFNNELYYTASNMNGSDGDDITDNDIRGIEVPENGAEENENKTNKKRGFYALEKADIFNLMCIPPLTREREIDTTTLSEALQYCKKRRAMLLVDPRTNWKSVGNITDSVKGVDTLGLRDENAAIFFPTVKISDPLKENRMEEFAPCGVIAGIIARTDVQRGVWKAPAGMDATLIGVRKLSVKITDEENGQLNPLGVNCLRSFPVVGNVLWGARTLKGADRLASEWKYIPVRRLALYIEESLYRGTQWVVFEPNDEPLWANIRLNIGSFLHNLFSQGAFQGLSPREAYFVKCDKETTTQNDINLGVVNILVGFAPLKPAEFVIIKIQQMAGQTEM